MTVTLRRLCLASLAAFTLAAAPGFAEDAMAPAVLAPISDADFALCNQQAGAITFPAAMQAALAGCHGLHEGMDVMGAIDSLGMEGDAMAPADAMAPTP
ncbi:hypothetical protein [uncultured Devosia sp.]|uniref:hypothetical protein n=1 Tax=uncultured Devosia sp. TaxID=211434 RepID=UPI0035CAEFE5